MSDHLKDLYKAASKGFLTSETCGPDGKYLYVCRFRNMDDLNAYEDAWRAAMLAVRDGGSMRQVPEVLVKANDEIGNCPLRSPARSIAIRQFQALAGEYVRRLIDESSLAAPTSGDDAAMEAWHSTLNDASELFGNAPDDRFASRASRVVTYLKNSKPEATPAQAGAELPAPEYETILGRMAFTADQMRLAVKEQAERAEVAEARVREAEGLLRGIIPYLPPGHLAQQTRERIAAFLAASGETK